MMKKTKFKILELLIFMIFLLELIIDVVSFKSNRTNLYVFNKIVDSYLSV